MSMVPLKQCCMCFIHTYLNLYKPLVSLYMKRLYLKFMFDWVGTFVQAVSGVGGGDMLMSLPTSASVISR